MTDPSRDAPRLTRMFVQAFTASTVRRAKISTTAVIRIELVLKSRFLS